MRSHVLSSMTDQFNVNQAIITLILLFISCISSYADAIDQKKLNFKVDPTTLMNGDIHYSLVTASPSKFTGKYPDFADLDSLNFLHSPNIKIVISKSAYIIKKPAGFFDHQTVGSEAFLAHFLGDQKLSKLNENDYLITVPGKDGYTYKMRTYFDSDDISTLANSKIVRAVTQVKKLDLLSQSASSTIFRDFRDFSKYSVGGIQISSIIPLKETRTLIITYSITGVKSEFAKKSSLKKSYKEEIQAQKELIESFK
jgi:hypothetical protein